MRSDASARSCGASHEQRPPARRYRLETLRRNHPRTVRLRYSSRDPWQALGHGGAAPFTDKHAAGPRIADQQPGWFVARANSPDQAVFLDRRPAAIVSGGILHAGDGQHVGHASTTVVTTRKSGIHASPAHITANFEPGGRAQQLEITLFAAWQTDLNRPARHIIQFPLMGILHHSFWM